MRRLLVILALACVGQGCGPAADLWLRVEAPLVVPVDCDALVVRVEQVGNGAELYQRTFALTASSQFPVTLSLTTRDAERLAPATLRVFATARLQGADVAGPASTDVVLRDGQVTEARIQLSRPP